MKKICWFSWLSNRMWSALGAAFLAGMTGMAVAQTAPPEAQPVTAPKGYTVHQAIDLGGRIATVNGSGAMYDTLVNEQSGPRIQGETFEMHALPGARNTLFDNLTAFGSGFGGDPYNFAKLDFYKGKSYEFSGIFRRDRQYFDYDLLGNPNIPSGQSIPIGPTASPTGSLPWIQINQSPFLFNTVRRMTDVNATFLPLDKVTYRIAYSHGTFEGPSLSPSGYFFGGSSDVLLQQMQRNGTDYFTFGVDWKPVKDTRLTLEEQIDHYKADSYFTMDPAYYRVQEPNGTKVALFAGYDALTPTYTSTSACNANSVGTTPLLSAPNTPGGLPVINPACNVIVSYIRTQPTRFLFPTEIVRFQSSTIRNISMNGDVRYTYAKMNLPAYFEDFKGLVKTTRELTYTGVASARREVTAADFGIVWQAARTFSIEDQVTYSSVQQPGSSTMTSATTVATPTTANSETINNPTLTTTSAAIGAATIEGNSAVGVTASNFFGQRYITNDLTATWNGWSRATLALTYRHQNHLIGEGIPHNEPLAVAETTDGTVTINQDGGILSLALRPTSKWDVNGSAELLYADNVFTPVAPRELQHYRVHTLYRLKPWAVLSGAYNDLERHDNTNNNQSAAALYASSKGASGDLYVGPLQHVDHSRVASVGAQINPNEHYGFDLNYSFSDVYAATNICYSGGASAALPLAAAPLNGAGCPGAPAAHGAFTPNTLLEFGPVKDFMDAPTQYGSAAVRLSPVEGVNWGIGYHITSVNGSRFYNDPRDVAGSLNSSWQSPYVNVAWTVRPGWIWKAEYDHYGYGEGGASGAPYCTTQAALPTTAGGPAPVVACSATGQQVGMKLSNAGETAPRTFRANNVVLGFHYEF